MKTLSMILVGLALVGLGACTAATDESSDSTDMGDAETVTVSVSGMT